ncbi:restriction endonuclease, partial [Methylobacterium sp. WL93]
MPGQPSLVARLFWIAVVGGGLSLRYGRGGLLLSGAALGLV